MEPNTLIQRYLLGIATEDEVRELEAALESSAELRREFVRASQMDVVGREVAIEQSIGVGEFRVLPAESSDETRRHSWRRFGRRYGWLIATVAASFLLMLTFWPRSEPSIATIVSSENAAWESALSTRPGDQLTAGTLNLKAGVATIRFTKGAELLLEAPATLELISDMRCRLESGAGVVNVPDSAIGFVVETPGGYTEDFGTRFAIRVDEEEQQSDLQLIEGEIEVHHMRSGKSLRLRDVGAAVLVSEESIRLVQDSDGTDDENSSAKPEILVIGTNGRCGTAMPRFQKRSKYIDPAILSVKRSGSGKWDFRSFFSFDLSGVDVDRVSSVRLRLNLVPSKRGLVSRLPKVNRFGIYGLTNQAKTNWEIESSWEDAPGPEDGILLGTFDIERSQSRGVFGIEGDILLQFLKQQLDQPVTLILVRETTQIEGTARDAGGPGMTHMFASDSHPESVGPQLEFTVKGR